MVKSLLMIFFSVSLAAVGQLLLKMGMNKVGPISMTQARGVSAIAANIITNTQVMGGLSLYFISALVWLIVLSRVNLSFAYPLLGTSYIVVMVGSQVFLNESVSGLRWAGALLISLGVVLISRT